MSKRVKPPTKREIRIRCKEIQRGWTQQERRRRAVKRSPWTPPRTKVCPIDRSYDWDGEDAA